MGRSDLVLPVSSYIKETLDALVAREYRCAILPMGVPGERFCAGQKDLGTERKKIKLLFVGKLVEKKGLKYLLAALKVLKEKNVHVDLVIAGSGPLDAQLKGYVDGNGLGPEVSFLGWTPNEKLPRLYVESDITVVPSVYDEKGETEGMPVVVLESMAVGTPVLASRISGIPDTVRDGINGWLVEYGSGEAIAAKIEQLCEMDLSGISKAASDTALNYTCDVIASRYHDEIEGLSK